MCGKFQWKGHALLGKKSFEGLPEWEKELFKPDISPEALDKPYIPDAIGTAADKTAYLCAILDLVYYDECRAYATLPDGRWIPHSLPDANMQSSCGSGLPVSNKASVSIIEMLMRKMIDAIKDGDWETAIRHGGALAHFLQEPFTPAHVVVNSIFYEFFPDVDPERHINMHCLFDAASGDFSALPPRLMGTTIKEAAYRLQIEIQKGIREAKKLIYPIINSFYNGEPESERKRRLADQSRKAAFVTTSAWHTAICIAFDKFDEKELEALDSLDLIDVPCYFWHPCKYMEMIPGRLVKDGRKIPIHVWEQTPFGNKQEILVEDGFGMWGHMGVKFFLSAGVYSTFRCKVGLPSRHTEGQDEHTSTTFFIEIDDDENTAYSEDMNYNCERVAEVGLVPEREVVDIEVNIKNATTLLIGAKSLPRVDPRTGETIFSIPHVGVCEPVLLKD